MTIAIERGASVNELSFDLCSGKWCSKRRVRAKHGSKWEFSGGREVKIPEYSCVEIAWSCLLIDDCQVRCSYRN